MTWLSWNSISNTIDRLKTERSFGDSSVIICHILTKNQQTYKKVLKFKELSRFLWKLYDQQQSVMVQLILTDKYGSVLYKTKKGAYNSDDRISHDNNKLTIQRWNYMDKTERNIFLRILIAQINSQI